MHQPDFIRLCIELGVLRFGEFKLKSGRMSPYFFNAGLFNTGHAIAGLGRHYARAAALSGLAFEMMFGPAYKGIPLVTTTAAALAEHEHRNLPFAFNRKEAKDHGEGGTIVGAPLQKMQMQLEQMAKSKNPQERMRLMQEHMKTMQDNMMMGKGMMMGDCPMRDGGGMGMMGSGMGPGMMGGGMMGGGGMGQGPQGGMSPEAMTQRMQMMEKRMDMMQMMMEQMSNGQPAAK